MPSFVPLVQNSDKYPQLFWLLRINPPSCFYLQNVEWLSFDLLYFGCVFTSTHSCLASLGYVKLLFGSLSQLALIISCSQSKGLCRMLSNSMLPCENTALSHEKLDNLHCILGTSQLLGFNLTCI